MLRAVRAAEVGAFLSPLAGRSERWAGCCAAVEACGAVRGRHATMLATAATTFELFEQWLTGPGD